MTRKIACIAAVLLVLSSAKVWTCEWDIDTLQMERLRFPGVLEIITGKFVRHSKAYYEWRVEDRIKRLEKTPGDPALIDDLAVGFDKLGRQAEGITILEKCLAEHPDRYETLANLGTLLFHAGQLDESKGYIRRAIEVNPDAHFGRERYQLLLTEYLQQSEWEKSGVMSPGSRERGTVYFGDYVLQAKFGNSKEWTKDTLTERLAELQSAIKGVLGMMHFANFESPILLEALGDLMMGIDDQQHAARAYLRAAEFSKKESAAKRYREMAKESMSGHIPERYPISAIQGYLEGEIADAQTWFAEIEKNEAKWISKDTDVDHEFAAIYYQPTLDATIALAANELKAAQALEEEAAASARSATDTPEADNTVPNALFYYFSLAVLLVALVAIFWRFRMSCPLAHPKEEMPHSA